MITSSNNTQVKNVIQLNAKSKVRNKQGCFIVEGRKMFEEAPVNQIEKVFVSQGFFEKYTSEKLNLCKYEIVEDDVFKGMSDTQTPQGILCILRQFSYSFLDMEKRAEQTQSKPLLALLEDLQDPGNVGTIFRTAEGAGVTGIILTKKCVDVYNPKTIRSTMGSIYRMPFFYTDDLEETLEQLKERKIETYAAHLQGKLDYDQEDYLGGSAFLIGNEGNGLTEELSKKANHLIKIPMEGQLESLNAAMATGILFYEAYRQRRHKL